MWEKHTVIRQGNTYCQKQGVDQSRRLHVVRHTLTLTQALTVHPLHSSDHSSLFASPSLTFPFPMQLWKKKSLREDDNRGRDRVFKAPSHRGRCAQAGAAGYPPSCALIGCSVPTSSDEGLHHGTAIQRRPKRRGTGRKVQTSGRHMRHSSQSAASSLFLLNKQIVFFNNGGEVCSGNMHRHRYAI